MAESHRRIMFRLPAGVSQKERQIKIRKHYEDRLCFKAKSADGLIPVGHSALKHSRRATHCLPETMGLPRNPSSALSRA
jgi:hypothetical protein